MDRSRKIIFQVFSPVDCLAYHPEEVCFRSL